jgi:proline iminopeptidase
VEPRLNTLESINPPGIRTAGIRMIPVMGGQYKVWTKTLPALGERKATVLALHGGPGFTHNYLEALESFLPEAGFELIYYDQLGCGNSDIPDDTSLWTLERYLQEVEDVRSALGLEDFVLYGQSWGGMLSIEYALHFQQHLRGLVISNMTAGMKAYLRRINDIKLKLPPEKLARVNELEAAEDFDNPDYERIMMEDLYPEAICRIQPWPESVTRAFRLANLKIYNHMQGKSEFVVTGTFKDWERWDRLPEITVRTLTLGAHYDSMDPADLIKMAKLMPNAISAICPNGSHLAMWDDQAIYFEHLLKFLNSL